MFRSSRYIAWVALLLLMGVAACTSGPAGSTPQVANVSLPAGSVRGTVTVSYDLADAGGYPVQIEAAYRLEGGAWRAATGSGRGGSGDGLSS